MGSATERPEGYALRGRRVLPGYSLPGGLSVPAPQSAVSLQRSRVDYIQNPHLPLQHQFQRSDLFGHD